MTATINIQNKPVIPEQVKPAPKSVALLSKEIKTEPNNIHSIKLTKVEQKTNVSEANKTEETTEDENSSKPTLDDAVKQLNSYVQSINRNIEFNIDTDSGETVVKVIDSETEKLIRQIPNEEALNMTKQLTESLINESGETGLLLSKLQA